PQCARPPQKNAKRFRPAGTTTVSHYRYMTGELEIADGGAKVIDRKRFS
ncbi:MAG: hypothetical protein ACI9OJ_002992, partial [Myxococcota bacterium]